MKEITQLQQRIASLEAQLRSLDLAMTAFEAFLQSETFTGTDANGEAKNWVATDFVVKWLREVRFAAFRAGKRAASDFDSEQASRENLAQNMERACAESAQGE